MQGKLLFPFLMVLVVSGLLLASCTAEPEIREVTRQVISEVPVTVEVTRVVIQETSITLPVEVTRLVEVLVVATPTVESETELTAEPLTPTPKPVTVTAVSGMRYTVQSGDTLYSISARTGVSMAAISAANNLDSSTLIFTGQELIIPGWSGGLAAIPTMAPAEPAPQPQPAPIIGANLLPNPSFEQGWYFYNGVNEWQLPDNWSLAVEEGPNTLNPGSGGNFLRPEIRLLTRAHIPPGEREQFVFDGEKTIKAFKGDAPTSFAIFTDMTLPPGRYRLTIRFFPDTVLAYSGSQKVWNLEPLAAEYRLIVNNGGSGWNSAVVGTQNSPSYEFSISETQTVRLGGAFRNRYIGSNNGWFLDNWSLQAIGAP